MPNETKTKPAAKPDPELTRQKKEERSRAARRRNRQLIGFALAILIVVGAISVVNMGVNMVRSMLSSEDQWEMYNTLFEPVVWFDLLPFESVTQVDENSIKQICIWGAYSKLNNAGELTRNDYGEPLIPASEVDLYGVSLFGPDFRFTVHDTFSDPSQDLTYYYETSSTMYALPATSLMPDYVGRVVDIQREQGGVRRVIMGYVSTRTADDQIIATLDYDHPDHFMDFMLRRDGGQYYLFAIRANTTFTMEQQGTDNTAQPGEEDDAPPASSGDSSDANA